MLLLIEEVQKLETELPNLIKKWSEEYLKP